MARKPKVEKINTVTFRPDSRNGSKDYQIPKDIAKRLFEEGVIYGDATNGGYMPNPNSNYNVRQHKVEDEQSNCLTHRPYARDYVS